MSLSVSRWVISVSIMAALQLPAHTAEAQETPTSRIQDEQAVQVPKFSVISVRETNGSIVHEGLQADGYTGIGVNLAQLIMEAYGIPQLDRILGLPTWRNEKRFDVQAKVDDADVPVLAKLSFPQRRTMLRQILAERFHLTMHEEERVQPIFLLTANAKLGPSLEKSPADDPNSSLPKGPVRVIRHSRRGQLDLERFTMTDLAQQLSGLFHKQVVNQTNLDGLYNLQLTWNPDEMASTASDASLSSNTDPSIFTAIQEQLGLKLKPDKGPVRVWVIDHIDLPSDN